ncbi:Coenzyme F420 hydrogenase/dehydrogenase, beta subunit C-terminal domain [Pseudorhodoferax sp. Leaf265]|uniref:Coenzyme F420 hydrogenase/dehydrogenase, beta subunit C-terminal domain n=1 Tax=Pseudorhodoferax sp. Leaf265 TaxID=1736315 RepID=UPI000A4AA312|nr:Coenzyme F420 hydrogenase/dehydrogenase, beta subunit C-terminal domain [Pseudorhodoferax sp. Leaf265]
MKSASLNSGATDGSLVDVVRGGYCVGCGACAAVADPPVAMKFDRFARYTPERVSAARGTASEQVCPFLAGPNEDVLAAQQFGELGGGHDARLGWYQGLYAGHALERRHRDEGSSGGLTSWLLAELLHRGLVTGVIHVRPLEENGRPRFAYTVSTSIDMVAANAKTRYYPVEMSEVMAHVRATPGRYVFVGVPCYVKAVRRLMRDDAVLKERIVYALSLFCGHMKSGRFAESLAWQMGAKPDDWKTVDFRRKLSDRPASSYGFAVQPHDGAAESVTPMGKLEGYDWGMGVFRLSACDYCDDVVGETADASFGDAWLPAYVNDSAGTSLVIVRHPELQQLFVEAGRDGRIALDASSVDDMVKSQDASFRHRRTGLAYRLWLKDKKGQWRPTKRVQADASHVVPIYRLIFRYRMFMSWSSHLVFAIARDMKMLPVYTLYVRVLARLNKSLVGLSRSPRFSRRG